MGSQNFRVKNGLEVGTGITISPNGNINSSGISTFNGVVIGGATTSLLVQGNARIIGILSVGQGTITFDGDNNQITVGSGITLSHTNGIYVGSSNITSTGLSISNVNASGIVTASSFVGPITGTASTASFATTSFGLSGSPNITVGTIAATSLNVSGISTFAGITTHTASLFGTQAIFSGVVTATSFVGSIAGTASTASFATTSFGLSGSPNITVGTVVGTAGTLIAGIGIQSGGVSIASTIKTLNFIGAGNTFNVVGDRLDVSISGSGGGAGVSSTGILTCRGFANSSFISESIVMNDFYNQGTNYGMIGPISIGVGATVNVGAGNTFVII